MTPQKRLQRGPLSPRWFWLMVAFMAVGLMGANGTGPDPHYWTPFSFMTDPSYSVWEQIALIANVFIAIGGLVYAYILIKEVYRTETGTPRMQEIAKAVREGALAYLKRQFTTVAVLIVIVT